MTRKILTGALLFTALLLGCEGRDHTNPFDPSNPDTGGVPPLLDARAQNGSVSLAWDIGRLEGIRLLRVYRREGGLEPVLLTPDGLGPEQRAVADGHVVNGASYAYRLELELDSGARPSSDWDEATPGTAVAWFADSDGGGLGRLSADGRDLIGRVREGLWYLDIVPDSAEGGFWAAEYLEGSLELYRRDGTRLVHHAVPGARALALEPGGANVWVGSFSTGILERRTRAGDLAWSDPEAGPIDALTSPRAGEVWAACATGEVRFYRDDERLFTIADFVRPVAFASSGGNRLFVLDHDARDVRVFDHAGFPLGGTGAIFASPTDIDGDGSGGIWVADAGRGGLVHLDGQLREIGVLPAAGVLGVTWDPQERLLWTVGDGHVRRFDPDGTLVSDLSVGVRPVKLALFHEADPQ